jgi:hypothetical protein
MVTRSGMYRVVVSETHHPYLRTGIYQVTVKKQTNLQGGSYMATVHKLLDRTDKTLDGALIGFKPASGTPHPQGNHSWFYQQGGCFESLPRLEEFESQHQVVCTVIEIPELDALAQRTYRKKWLELLEREQIQSCKLLEIEDKGLRGIAIATASTTQNEY